MKKTGLLLFSILFTLCANAQLNVDSLRNIWNNLNEPDEKRFNSLQILISQEYLTSKPDSAKLLANMMRDEAGKRNLIHYVADAYQLLGQSNDAEGNFTLTFKAYNDAKSLYEKLNDKNRLADLNLKISSTYLKRGDYSKALDYTERSLKYHQLINDSVSIPKDVYALSRIYYYKDEFATALKYQKQALELFKRINDTEGIAKTLNAIGLTCQNLNKPSEAIDYLNQSLVLNEKSGNRQLLSYNLNNLGRVYQDIGDYDKALDFFQRSLKIKLEVGDKWATSETLLRIGQSYQSKDDYQNSIQWCMKSMAITSELKEKRWRSETYKCLYESYKALNKLNEAIKYNELFIALEDSLEKDATEKKLQKMEFDKKLFSDSLKQEGEKLKIKTAFELEVRRKNSQRNIFIICSIFVLVLALVLWNRLKLVRKSKIEISRERDRSESLLLNILPAEVAEELKTKGSAEAKHFDQITVMFTDFKGFTMISEKLTPAELVTEIDTCFKAFDTIITKYNIEKIKTIGDSYMCAGGLPVMNKTNAIDMLNAAFEILQFMNKHKQEKISEGKEPFEIRIGIHTGPAVAGIVGVKKFAYDIWGDTVNIASRMESSGEPGKINISGSTYELVKDKFVCKHRGKIKAKNKGEVDMYFAEQIIHQSTF